MRWGMPILVMAVCAFLIFLVMGAMMLSAVFSEGRQRRRAAEGALAVEVPKVNTHAAGK